MQKFFEYNPQNIIQMKKNYLLFLFCLFFCGALSLFFENVFAQKVKFQSKIVSEKETPCPKGECALCEIIFPKITACPNKDLEKKLTDEILIMVLGESNNRTYKLFGDKAKAFIADYKELKKTTDGMGRWQQKIKVELLEVGNVVSLVYKEYSYSGGESDYYIRNSAHFDLNTSKKITLNDILVENYQELLAPVLEEKVRKMMKINEKMPLSEVNELKLKNKKLPLSNAFAFRKDGLHLNYSSLEITEPTITPPIIIISYQELKPFLRKNNLLKK